MEIFWYIFFVLAVLAFGTAIYLLSNRKLGMIRFVYCLVACAASALFIYVPPFFSEYNPVAAALGSIINILQVISLDASYLAYYETIVRCISSELFIKAYEVVLAVIHVALPAISAMTAVTMIIQFLSQLRLRALRRTKQNLYIFSHVNYNSIMLAEDIRKHDLKGEIIFLEEDDNQDHTSLQDNLICTVLDEKIENIQIKGKRNKVQYYCISDDEERNLNEGLALLNLLNKEEKEVQKNRSIFLFSGNPLVEPMVDSMDKGLVEIDVINRFQMSAYRLLERKPLVDAITPENKISMLLYGFGPVNREILRAASWCGQLAGTKLQIRVIADLEQAEIDDFMFAYPGLFTQNYDIQFLTCKSRKEAQEHLRAHCADAGYIVVEGQSESDTIEKAVFLRRFYYKEDPNFANKPAIYAYIENADKSLAVSNLRTAEAKAERRVSYDIVPFGIASEVFTFENVTDSYIEKLAKNVHLVYEDIFSDTEIDATEAIGRYNLFEVNKRSNRANALHIRYKLSMLGLDYTDDPDATEVDLKDYLNAETLERLTFAEHSRWMAFLESEGWTDVTVDQVERYKASGISRGRHNCPLLKVHPYICPFEDLKECSDRLGLPDSTVYDRDLISRIPDILHDRWGITGKKYKIVVKK